MDVIFVGAFLLVLAKLSWDDWKTRQLRDIDLALLWTSLLIPFYTQGIEATFLVFAVAGLGFQTTYMLGYALPIMIWKKPLIRFGDVILFPAILAFCGLIYGLMGAYLAMLFLGICLVYSYKRELPLASCMFSITAGLVVFVALFG